MRYFFYIIPVSDLEDWLDGVLYLSCKIDHSELANTVCPRNVTGKSQSKIARYCTGSGTQDSTLLRPRGLARNSEDIYALGILDATALAVSRVFLTRFQLLSRQGPVTKGH